MTAELEINYDLVPDDPQGRCWAELPDYELNLHNRAMRGETSGAGPAWYQRISSEILRRDLIDKLHELWLGEPAPEALLGLEVRTLDQQTDQIQALNEALNQRREELARRDQEPEYSSVQLALFDYSSLDAPTADVVRRCTDEIRRRVASTLAHGVEIGKNLRVVKAELARGQFDGWLAQEIGFSRDSADRFIRFADYADESPRFAEHLSQFDKSAAHLLLAPSTPDEVRTQATALAESGERVTHAIAKELIEAHRPEPAARITDRPISVDSAEAPMDIPGVCRVCGCTDETPCDEEVADGGTVSCRWVDQRAATLCSNCHRLMESNGWDEATLHRRIQHERESAEPLFDQAESPEEAVDEPGAEAPIIPEVVATGRSDGDLLTLLRGTVGGMEPADLIKSGFTEKQLEEALVARTIEESKGRLLYRWHGSAVAGAVRTHKPATVLQLEELGIPRHAIAGAEADGLIKRNSDGLYVPAEPKPAGKHPLEELLKGKSLTVTFSFIPSLKEKGMVTVRLSSQEPTEAKTLPVEIGRIKFPDAVLGLITQQIAAAKAKPAAGAKRESSAKKAPAKKAASKKPAAAKKPAQKSKPKGKK